MIEPVSAVAVAAIYAVVCWSRAGSERVILRARADLVSAATRLPPGTRIDGLGQDGSRWTVVVPSTLASAAEEAGDVQ